MTEEFLAAVRELVAELTKETASGLISRRALIALDHVHRLLDTVPIAPANEPPAILSALEFT